MSVEERDGGVTGAVPAPGASQYDGPPMDGARRDARAGTPVAVVAVVILLLALATFAAPSSATYDAWSWIVWGREIVHGDLNTVSGPSWKPLPVMVTTVAAPLGSLAPDVWVLVARIGAITAVVLAFALARRLGGTAAGLLAAVGLGLAPWWIWNGWLANSEGLLVAVVLGAILAELDGRRRLAFACGIAAGLLRPEAWPFVLAYAAWLAWRGSRRDRVMVAAGLAILPLAWLLPEKWGSGDFWRAASRAQNPDPGAASLTDRPAWTVTKDFFTMLPTATWAVVAAAVLAGVALYLALRRNGAFPAAVAPPGTPRRAWPIILAVAGLGVAWLAIVVVLTTRGFSGNERYLIPPVALVLVAASAGFGRLLMRIPVQVGTALIAVLGVAIAVAAIDDVPRQLRSATYESRLIDDLPKAIAAAGGADRINRCADVSTHKFMVPQAAWYLGRHLEQVSMIPEGPTQVVLRLRLQQHGGWTPTVRHIPGLETWMATPFWTIVARCDISGGGR